MTQVKGGFLFSSKNFVYTVWLHKRHIKANNTVHLSPTCIYFKLKTFVTYDRNKRKRTDSIEHPTHICTSSEDNIENISDMKMINWFDVDNRSFSANVFWFDEDKLLKSTANDVSSWYSRDNTKSIGDLIANSWYPNSYLIEYFISIYHCFMQW